MSNWLGLAGAQAPSFSMDGLSSMNAGAMASLGGAVGSPGGGVSLSFGELHVSTTASDGKSFAMQFIDTLRYDPGIRQKLAALTSLRPEGAHGY